MGRKLERLFELTSLHLPTSLSISTSVTNFVIYQRNLCPDHVFLIKTLQVAILHKVSKLASFDCLNCKIAKQPHMSFPDSSSSCDTPLGLIHFDICDLTPTSIINGYHYFVLFIDGYSRFTCIYFLNKIILSYLKSTFFLLI